MIKLISSLFALSLVLSTVAYYVILAFVTITDPSNFDEFNDKK